MDSLQIKDAIQNISPTNRFFKGCYYNRNIPFHLMRERECFFIVNTIIDIRKMGHWVLLFIKDFCLYYFDSFGLSPVDYGWDIEHFYTSYPGYKAQVFHTPIQNDVSYVCGAYTIFFAHCMSMDYSLSHIRKLFTRNRRRNDSFIVSRIYSLVGMDVECQSNFCSNLMFFEKCRKYCSC